MTKICAICKQEKPFSEYHRRKTRKNAIQSACKTCCLKRLNDFSKTEKGKACQKRYQQSEAGRAVQKRYRQGLVGYLKQVFCNMKQRCNNSKNPYYKNYGGRGIKCLFENANEFVDYVINELSYNTFEKIKGLQIDRINNNGSYQSGNIRFVTRSENNRNRRI